MPKHRKQHRTPLRLSGIESQSAPWVVIYGLFLIHMLLFGVTSFLLSYADPSNMTYTGELDRKAFMAIVSILPITVYIIFYIFIFGLDEIKWLIINSLIGVLGIYSQLGWILERFETSAADYPIQAHIVPGIYYVLYTFLLRRAALHLLRAEEGTRKKLIIDIGYVAFSVGFYFWSLKQ